jgi:hypothetical protein
MSLVNCADCGKEVSERASVCIHCGGPIVAIPVESRATTSKKTGPKVIILGLLVVVLATLTPGMWRAFQPTLQAAGMVPAPRWVVDNAGGNDDCSVLGDYCVRARCAVTNVGDASGTARIAAELYEGERQLVATRTATRFLTATAQDTLSFDFPEAGMNKNQKFRCLALTD